MKRILLLIAVITWFGFALHFTAVSESANSLVASWLAAQTNILTWSAEVIQTRTFKTLTQPLKATGQVWFAAPDRFRWELGSPPQTIAVRSGSELLLVYPRLKRIERYTLAGNRSGPWRDALALLDAGFPRSRAELEARYEIVDESESGTTCVLTLHPRSAPARRMIPKIRIEFDTGSFALTATELEFADGSRMRNEFKDPKLNPKFEEGIFEPEIPTDYRVVQPLKR
jgi:outer membrane lipoprotein-sorting protein